MRSLSQRYMGHIPILESFLTLRLFTTYMLHLQWNHCAVISSPCLQCYSFCSQSYCRFILQEILVALTLNIAQSRARRYSETNITRDTHMTRLNVMLFFAPAQQVPWIINRDSVWINFFQFQKNIYLRYVSNINGSECCHGSKPKYLCILNLTLTLTFTITPTLTNFWP